MDFKGGVVSKDLPRVKIQDRAIPLSSEERLRRDVKKFAALIPAEPEPNQGRVAEIKEEIKKGTYLTRDKIEETAAHLALRLTRPES